MDPFESNAFSTREMTAQVDRVDYAPQALGAMNLFTDRPLRQERIMIDVRDRELTLIPTTPRGSAPHQLTPAGRSALPMATPRLVKASTIKATEIAGVRAFGQQSAVETMRAEVALRLGMLRQDLELTMEHHRLGAIQGVVLDADGTTVIEDFYDAFGISRPAVVDFELDDDATEVRAKVAGVVRAMTVAAKGAMTAGTMVYALAGDDFYEALIAHPKVEKFYLQRSGRDLAEEGGPFASIRLFGVTFLNYRGSDDGAVAVASDEAKFFPVGSPGTFVRALSPADEYVEHVGELGREVYARQYAQHVNGSESPQTGRVVQVDSYPLHICMRPEMLRSAVMA